MRSPSDSTHPRDRERPVQSSHQRIQSSSHGRSGKKSILGALRLARSGTLVTKGDSQAVSESITTSDSLDSPLHGNYAPDAPEASLEAKYLISLMAKNLGWDFMYVIRIYPGFSGSIELAGSNPSSATNNVNDVFDRRYIRLLVSEGLLIPLLSSASLFTCVPFEAPGVYSIATTDRVKEMATNREGQRTVLVTWDSNLE